MARRGELHAETVGIVLVMANELLHVLEFAF